MAQKIIWTKDALQDFRNIVDYLEQEWSLSIAEEFTEKAFAIINLISVMPYMGIQSKGKPNVRSIVITKHNLLFYRTEEGAIVLLNFFDTRSEPKSNE